MQEGLSIKNNFSFDRQYGLIVKNEGNFDNIFSLSISNISNLYVFVCDEFNNPLIATIQINGGLNVDGFYSGFDNYSFVTDSAESVTFEASANGYTTNQIIQTVNEFGYITVKIVLSLDILSFSCETFPINQDLMAISRVIDGGLIRVIFTGSNNFNPANYDYYYDAFVVGSSKYTVIELEGNIVSSTSDSITIDFNPVEFESEVCYIPSISSKQC